MHAGFGLAVALAFAFSLTNGFHDASNAIATLVATRAARPLQAVVLAAVFNVLGPLVRRRGGRRHDRGHRHARAGGGDPGHRRRAGGGGVLERAHVVARAALELRARARRRPRRRRRCSRAASTPSAGAAWTACTRSASSARSSRWPSRRRSAPSWRWLAVRGLRSIGRRATRRWIAPVRAGQWATAAALAFSHGANDAQKAAGIVAALLLADGRIGQLAPPTWVELGQRPRADRRDRLRRLADRQDRRPAHLSHPADRRSRQQRGRRRRHPRRVARRRPGLHDAGGRIVGRGGGRRTPALAPRATGRSSATWAWRG